MKMRYWSLELRSRMNDSHVQLSLGNRKSKLNLTDKTCFPVFRSTSRRCSFKFIYNRLNFDVVRLITHARRPSRCEWWFSSLISGYGREAVIPFPPFAITLITVFIFPILKISSVHVPPEFPFDKWRCPVYRAADRLFNVNEWWINNE